LSRSGEFGGSADSPLDGYPNLMLLAENAFASPAVANGGPVPDGETWVLLGADFSGSATGAASLVAYVYTAGSAIAWAQSITVDPLSLWAGAAWRGFMPFYPGQTLQIEAKVVGAAAYTGCAGWGIVLPYVSAP
jgi:hypothetical protein